jgi:hypothetical protein
VLMPHHVDIVPKSFPTLQFIGNRVSGLDRSSTLKRVPPMRRDVDGSDLIRD